MSNKFDKNTSFGDKFNLFKDTWFQNGFYEPSQEVISVKDMISTPNAAEWMPRIVEEAVREPAEPNLMIPALLDNVQYNGAAKITLGAIGSLVAFDIGEGEEYPEQSLNIAPGSMTIATGKSGLAFKFTDEMLRDSVYDVINLHLRAGAAALARRKEFKGFDYINSMGVTLFDNVSPTTSIFGVCTGRGMSGAGNGSCRMEDLLKAYAHLMIQGYVPDTILMHPLAWSIWMTDPMLQAVVKNTGMGSWFQPHNMPKSALPWKSSSQGGAGINSGYGAYVPAGNAASATATDPIKLDQNLQSAAVIPSYFPHPLRVLVSSYAPYHKNNQTVDIQIFDSRNLGALLIRQGVTSDRWEDLSTDITKVKMKEEYGFQIYEDGLAIGVIRNVPIKPNYISGPVQPTISTSGSLEDIVATTAISF
jgi:hypothetical protein